MLLSLYVIVSTKSGSLMSPKDQPLRIPADCSSQVSMYGFKQAHFKAHKPVKTDAQKQAQRQAILAQVPAEQRKSITDSLMGQALEMGMVCSARPGRTLQAIHE